MSICVPITNNAINNIVVRFFPHILSPAKTQKKNLLQLFVLSVCLFVCLCFTQDWSYFDSSLVIAYS